MILIAAFRRVLEAVIEALLCRTIRFWQFLVKALVVNVEQDEPASGRFLRSNVDVLVRGIGFADRCPRG